MLQYKVVNQDERGEISVLFDPDEKDDKDIAILRTNKGFARGGCIHNLNDETAIVVKGKIRYVRDSHMSYEHEKDIVFIQKGTPHYYVSLTDSIVIEWGATVPEKLEKHPETRKIVEKINEQVKK